ncbi:tRNA (adenosine(37)-N6)-threonylcarbamoyltransferase complex transferase subunit TsaD [archaeon]|nr:tRNA (adenosine(37)-N6)-threonylcarbamoyltransferase complex transferase subunit TsaD [archaeon]
MLSLGIECTAHTFGIGITDGEKILADAKDMYKPEKGGIHPIEAKIHHENVKEKVLEEALNKAKVHLNDIDIFSYSAGPGLPPCLKVGVEFVSKISGKKPVFAVNHPVAHIEIGRFLAKCNDPIVIYVSGGNTQIIGYAAGRYRVFGETEDIAIGNAIDTFMREVTDNAGFGGPMMEKLAEGGNYIELPYVVKGMDLSFSGILTSATQKWKKESIEKSERDRSVLLSDLCFSFQETCYSMLTEVTERALAHAGKTEVLVTGGVAASKRLREMLDIMCRERGAKLFVCPVEYSGDNGAMISITGLLMKNSGQKSADKIDFNPKWRTDEAEITWMD